MAEASPRQQQHADRAVQRHDSSTRPFRDSRGNLVPGRIERGRRDALLRKDESADQRLRTVWNEGEFPFLFVQLAPFNYGNPTTLPRLWEAQTATLAVPDTGMAATQDIGNPTDIHPQGKQDVGNRLALWALAKAYGKAIVYSGPMYKAMSIDGSTIRLKFKDVGGGLVSRDGKPLSWFEVAGEDKKFVPADAKIDVDSVVVSSPRVAKPVAVRFAWNGVADPNLANMEGLPAVAFRTDRW